MPELLQTSPEGPPTAADRTQVANTFIATVYFTQATKLLDAGHYAEAEGYFREVLKIWPEHAGSLNNLGTAVWRQGRGVEAEEYHRRALAVNPNDYAILNNLGNVVWEQGRLDEAVRWLRRAVELKPDSAAALMNFGVTLSDLGEFDEALVFMRKSLELAPGEPDSHINMANTLSRMGKIDDALMCYDEAMRLKPDCPEARRNRAYIWLERGDFERGWPEYEWRLRCPKQGFLPVDTPRWAGEDLAGRSILLVAEQGLGDTTQFVRFAPIVKRRGAARLVVACPGQLVRLLASCPGVDHVVDYKRPLPDCDFHIHLMSLPAVLGATLTNLPAAPYLSVDEPTVAHWRPIVARALDREKKRRNHAPDSARAFTIGIAWQGNRANNIDRSRSFPLVHFAHLAAIPGVRLISIQKGEGTEQLDELAGRFAVADLRRAMPGGDDRRDFLDTAAVMSQLDLVVTPESAVAHLAGSLGVPVWVALSSVGDWRWLLDREDSPWYPTMRLFRQTTPRDWDGVFRRMADSLREKLAN